MCKIHPGKEVIDVCAHCGKQVCTVCAASLAGKTYCLECIRFIDATPVDQAEEVPWENRSEIGFLNAFIKTWLNLLLHPKKFFSGMPARSDIKNPFLFGLICGSLAVIVSALLNIILSLAGVQMPNLPSGAIPPPVAATVISYAALSLLSPILVAGGIFILSGVYHAVILIFGGREGFYATLRVLSYTNGLALFNIIPILGPIFVTIYSVVLFMLGFKHVQKLSTAKAVMAALLPMIVLFIIGFAAAFYLASTGALPEMQPGTTVPAAPAPVQ
jgi:hypothetical protein